MSDRFLREVHHLLWIEPSAAHGSVDAGWSCRDHAWVTALLLQSFGHRPALLHGEAFFVKGPSGKAESVSYRQRPHGWLVVQDIGAIDLSIKPRFDVSGDDYSLGIACVFANQCLPRGKGKAYFLDDAAMFARALEELPRRRNALSAVYLTKEAEYPHDGHLTHAAGWVGSALTQRLHAFYGNPSDLYCALFLHLRGFLEGDAASLATTSFDQAWKRLAGNRAGAVERARDCIVAAAGAEWRMPAAAAAKQAVENTRAVGAS